MSEKEVKKTSGSEELKGEIGKKYRLLVQILTSDPRYAKALAEVTGNSLHEKLSSTLVNLSYEIGGSLSIIKALIDLEFQRKVNHPTTILRQNSIVSKMMGKYTKKVGNEYLKLILKDLIEDLFEKPDFVLETNPNELKGEDVDKQAEENLKKLTDVCQTFLDAIIKKESIEAMPREIRAICYFIAEAGEKYKMNFTNTVLPLVSGFTMLRYICPGITVPNTCGIVEEKRIPSGNVRANLTAIAKVLQKLANGELFQIETPHLMPMNKFIEKNRAALTSYLKELPTDPEKQDGKLPFGDLVKTVTYQDVHNKKFNMEDLIFLHGLIYDFGYELIESLQTEVILTDNKRPISIVSLETDFLNLVHNLGPPEDRKQQKPKIDQKTGKEIVEKDKKALNKDGKDEKKDGEKKIRDTLKGKSTEEIDESLVTKTLEKLMEKSDSFDLSEFETVRFFYLGKPTKQNLPTFYFVLHRMELRYLQMSDLITVYIFKTLWKYLSKPYIIICDLSWTKPNEELNGALFRTIVNITRLMKKEFLLNCQNIYLLHPTFKVLTGLTDILNLFDNETRGKLVKQAHEWTDLIEIIEPTQVWIPFVSKKFVPITYNLSIVNGNKKIDRLLKLSHSSILEVDSKNGTVHNEILLSKIIEIRSRQGANEIIIKYTGESAQELSERDGGTIFTQAVEDNTKVETCTFVCFSANQRDLIIDAIYDSGIRCVSLNMDQSFIFQKENSKGKLETRTFKLTSDSILLFKEKSIKKEINYATIQSFYVDPENKQILYLNFTKKGVKKCYVLTSTRASAFRDSLLDAIMRFKFYVETEKELYTCTKVDSGLLKFFSKGKLLEQEEFDDTKWKIVFKIDAPHKELKKLFRKFKPENGRASLEDEHFKEVLEGLKLELSSEEYEEIKNRFDPKKRKYFTFDDLVKAYVYLLKQRTIVSKKQLLQKKVESNNKKDDKKD